MGGEPFKTVFGSSCSASAACPVERERVRLLLIRLTFTGLALTDAAFDTLP